MTNEAEKATPRPVDPKEVGHRIAMAREQAGLRQSELAEQIGVIPRSMQNYEYGRIPYRFLDRIADACGVSKEWILYGDGVVASDNGKAAPGFDARFDEIVQKLDEIVALLKKRR